VTSAVIFFIVGMVGLLTVPALGLAGAEITEASFMAGGIIVMVVIRLFSLAVQARYIVRQGAQRAVVACLTAEAATLIVGGLADFAGFPALATTITGAVVGITLVALMIKPAASRGW